MFHNDADDDNDDVNDDGDDACAASFFSPVSGCLPSVDPCVPMRSTLAVSSSSSELVRMFETGERASESFLLTMFHDFVTMAAFVSLTLMNSSQKHTALC